jgi:hypothetical protein
LIKSDPEIAAVISKLIKTKNVEDFNLTKEESRYNLNQGQIQSISDKIKTRIRDSQNILQLFPDIELSVQILISSILSPKDMVKTELLYKTVETVLPAEVSLQLISELKDHLEGHYKLKDEQAELLRDCLFENGSYVKAIIPEGVLDEIINSDRHLSTESYNELFTDVDTPKHLGILGNPGTTTVRRSALESFRLNEPIAPGYDHHFTLEDDKKQHRDTNISITDNYAILKLPKLTEKLSTNRIKDIIKPSMSLESSREMLSDTKFTNMLYKDTEVTSKSFMVIPTADNAKRKSIGRPLVLRLPSESVIPIYTPGNEKNHVGYFVMTDIDGNPVTLDTSLEQMEGLSSLTRGQNQNQPLSSLLLNKARRNLTEGQSEPTLDQITKVYGSIIEKDLVSRLKNGIYGSNIEIGDNQEVYRIMLARSLASSYTRLIYIPGELVGYFAFKYFNNGVGKSYLDDVKVLCSLRAILLFAKVMAQTKNSIATTHVNMTLDQNDPDPQKTVEMSISEIVRLRQQYFPLGINSPVDLVDWIQRAGLEFSFEGHPRLPQTKFDFETRNIQHNLPDSDLDEQLRKQTYMTFGLSPETVDNGYSADFATTVISNNILFSKRVVQLQNTLSIMLSDYGRKIIANDSYIVKDMFKVLINNKGLIEKSLTDEDKEIYNQDQVKFMHGLLDKYIENLVIEFPKPDITTIDNQSEAFGKYSDALDKSMDAWINSQFITSDLVGDVSSNIDSVKEVAKAYFLRKWMGENGFMPELNDIASADEEGMAKMDLYELNKVHMEGVIRSCMKLFKELVPLRDAANKDLKDLNVEEGDSSSSYDSGSGTESDTAVDDFGFGDEDGPPEEEEPTDEEAADEGTTEEKDVGI